MKKFSKRACWYQVRTALALYEKKDVIGCAPTGAGKTLSFWIPLLMALEDGEDKMSIVSCMAYKLICKKPEEELAGCNATVIEYFNDKINISI